VAQIFVPYETGHPRYHDVAYGLGPAMQPITSEECDGGTLLYSGRVCRQVENRGPTERFCTEGNCHVRIGKSLVLWSSSQMGAYNYMPRWEFHDDGTIEPAMGLSGVLQFGPTAHVHNVYWRLDLDIDGGENDRVEEFYRINPAAGDGSQGALGWVPILGETYRANDLDTFRKWRVVDTEKTNADGLPIGYELVPSPGNGNFRGTLAEGFTRGELWVTQAKPGERFVSTESADLLSGYVDGDSVDGQDVVLWYAAHEQHQPRSEDAPYMPTEWIRFELQPRNFFDQSPLEP
jgi:primary-amine oxidase